VVVFAFVTVMAFTTVPTPLWSLYAQRYRFSSLTITIVFAVYALAVALSRFLAGHLSDWHGRRRVLMPAVAIEILAGRGLHGLALAAWAAARQGVERHWHRGGDRDGHGLAVGAALREWARAGDRHWRDLGGLGLGGLIAGALAQWASPALHARADGASRPGSLAPSRLSHSPRRRSRRR
jgi:MFS family permease